jgi:hypothetical protein
MLKNEDTALAKAMRRIRSLRRIVLTGTPLQNNLKECKFIERVQRVHINHLCFAGCDSEVYCFQGYGTLQSCRLLPPCCFLHCGRLFCTEYEGSRFLWNVVNNLPDDTVLHTSLWIADIVCHCTDFLTLKTLIYEGTNWMKPLVTEFVM